MSVYKKKLIEVALPLEAINEASRKEKSPFTKRHPRALHVWWARRPLAACRAVLFASLVDDPSAHPDQFPTDEAQEAERQRLFRIIEELVKWENSTNETVLEAARAEIMRSTDGNPPPVLDPFCGGGSIPLEAQRLGLEAHASDLNPVAVLITKALIEIPSRFAGLPPANPDAQAKLANADWRGAQGLSEDVRYYGRWISEQAEERIGHLYPKVKLPAEHGGGEAAAVAWLWARTVKCPNPACGGQMPMVRSFALSTKKGKQAWVEPIVDAAEKTVRFEVRTGTGVAPEGTKQRGRTRCLFCGTDNITDAQVREQSVNHGIGSQLMAVVADARRGRVFVAPDQTHEGAVAVSPETTWLEQPLPDNPRWFSPPGYGLTTYRDLFNNRQLVALSTFSDLVLEARGQVLRDAEGGWPNLGAAATGVATATEYADAVGTYLGLSISRFTDFFNSICSWDAGNTNMRQLFARQAIPMAWDYAETNPLHGVVTIDSAAGWAATALDGLRPAAAGTATQLDATAAVENTSEAVVSTDPPYYDNIGYADLSDFFYVWLRRSLQDLYPDLFSTLLTPKAQELVATPYRFKGGKREAQAFFETGLGHAFERMREVGNADYPLTIYYAFKQAETQGEGDTSLASTGWETMLAGLLRNGFSITATWPMRTEQQQRSVAAGTNALASSVVLACRPRPIDAPLATRREYFSALKAELPAALRHLQRGNIAPVDLAQAAIGPGMAVFSRYSKVLGADNSPMPVREALAMINQVLDEVLAEQEGEFDADTRWAVVWFEQYGMAVGDFGVAEDLARAKVTSVEGMRQAGFLESKGGKVRLLRRDEMESDWDPTTDKRLTTWEVAHYLITALAEGEQAAADLARRLGPALAEQARDLAYRLYIICERKKWSQDGQAFNGLVVAWPQISQSAAAAPAATAEPQTRLDV